MASQGVLPTEDTEFTKERTVSAVGKSNFRTVGRRRGGRPTRGFFSHIHSDAQGGVSFDWMTRPAQ